MAIVFRISSNHLRDLNTHHSFYVVSSNEFIKLTGDREAYVLSNLFTRGAVAEHRLSEDWGGVASERSASQPSYGCYRNNQFL